MVNETNLNGNKEGSVSSLSSIGRSTSSDSQSDGRIGVASDISSDHEKTQRNAWESAIGALNKKLLALQEQEEECYTDAFKSKHKNWLTSSSMYACKIAEIVDEMSLLLKSEPPNYTSTAPTPSASELTTDAAALSQQGKNGQEPG